MYQPLNSEVNDKKFVRAAKFEVDTNLPINDNGHLLKCIRFFILEFRCSVHHSCNGFCFLLFNKTPIWPSPPDQMLCIESHSSSLTMDQL